ncbi:MAG: hypothetical protein Q9199_004643 [Rusavskia elegans]
MAAGEQAGLLDLQKELTCSICTEVLFQPLTLLDCLHTFCGSCLKEWFSWQASQASASKPNPYTCPSCRASVRETRPNATVTTLLDMYLQANPGRGRTQEEQNELRSKYKPGEQVLPRVRVEKIDAADERMLAEVREMSLRDAGVRSLGAYERGTRHRTAERRRDPSSDGRQRRRHQQPTSEHERPEASSRRQIGHQSSLRSLMSSSEIDSSEMEEEILRLVDEGWLDGIDLNNLDTSQVDELSERIAEAYRRRHRHRAGQENSPTANPGRSRDLSERHSRNNRRSSGAEPRQPTSHPPVSRPRLLEAYPTSASQQRRASSEHRRQTSPSPRSSVGRISTASHYQASRSSTDLSQRPSSSASRPPPTDLSSQGRRITDPSQTHTTRIRGHTRSEFIDAEQSASVGSAAPTGPVAERAPSRPTLPPRSSDPGQAHAAQTVDTSGLRENPSHSHGPPSAIHPVSRPAASAPDAPKLYTEPSIVCNRCDRQNIQYELHWNCSRCLAGEYNLCSRCYRLGRGCLHWFGFGHAALQRYQRDVKDPSKPKDPSPPHSLIGRRYGQPGPEMFVSSSAEGERNMTKQDPAQRLQSGAFCGSCSSNANECFWKCGSCNEGEWGFCNRCVDQGRCCSHPLLPVTHKSSLNSGSLLHDPNTSQGTSYVPAAGPHSPSSTHFLGLSSPNHYVPLTLSTKCNVCQFPIPPSKTRFHCPQCNDGDYNICTTSYLKLISSRRISVDDGDKGWRKCQNGHRMIVVGFEDSSAGQRRVVVKDMVGGLALKDGGDSGGDQSISQELSWQDGQQRHIRKVFGQHTSNEMQGSATTATPLLRKYPPSGGSGMRALAVWSYWPEEDATDELPFPRGAEIKEVEDINGDWFLGSYCGKMGVFPGNHVRVLDVVKS